MMTSPHLIADSFISVAAFSGVVLLMAVIQRQDGGPNSLDRRFLFGLGIVAALLAGRVLFWSTGFGLFDTITLVAAGMVPLAALFLTEGLLRRHAPFLFKAVVAAGTIFFAVLALLPDWLSEPWQSRALFTYQFIAFVGIGWLVVTRDRKQLSTAENLLVERMALSLLLIIPALATEFRAIALTPFIPVRLGGLAILFLCWLSVGLCRARSSHRATTASFSLLIVSAISAGFVIATIASLNTAETIQAVAISLSASLLAVIFNDSVALKAEERRDSLIRHVAEGSIDNTKQFLSGLQYQTLTNGALVLGEADLDDFDMNQLHDIFSSNPIHRVGDRQPESGMSEEGSEQLTWLFEKYDATHVFVAADKPLTLVVLNLPPLSSWPGAETELRAVQRIAWLLSKQEKTA